MSLSYLKEPLVQRKPTSNANITRDSPALESTGSSWRLPSMKKRGQSIRSWIRIDTYGNSGVIEVDKFTIMRQCDLPARDLRLLDPLFDYASTILGREKAIVVNLEQIRCIITADEVLLLNSLDNSVKHYVAELQRRLRSSSESTDKWKSEDVKLMKRRSTGGGRESWDLHNNINSISSPDILLPFEFKALEVALDATCTFLDSQASELEIEAYPLLDELTSKISTRNLERARRLKSGLVGVTRRVQKVRDEIEQLMDDDGDMAELYLTEKKLSMEMDQFGGDGGEQSLTTSFKSNDAQSYSAPVSPVSSPPDDDDTGRLRKSLSVARSRHASTKSSGEIGHESIEELEMLLEAYFVVIDSTLNKLTSLKEYIDDTEDFINIQLDNVRNQLILFELLLTTGTFVLAIYGLVAGIFGVNFDLPLFDDEGAFKWVLIITGVSGVVIYCAFLALYKYKRLMAL